MSARTDRRGFLNRTLLGAAGVGAACSFEESILLAAVKEGAAEKPRTKPDINPSSMPRGKIGNVSISRLFLGGNLIGGWAHSRDLIYVKTFHLDRYWSATPKEKREEWCWYKPMGSEPGTYHDNMFCINPEETAAFMQSVEKPWVAFKTMAAGAIHPQVGFSYAYRNGADFIVAGMFDFQVEQDAKLAIEALGKVRNRKRPWRA